MAAIDEQRTPAPSTATTSGRRLRLAARWALSMPLALVRWVFSRVPLYRRNRGPEQDWDVPDPGRALPGDPDTLQGIDTGKGAVFHRRYWIDVTDTPVTPEELVDDVAGHIDALAPGELARFEAVDDDGGTSPLEAGQELIVRLPGPWDGPVRVIDRSPTSFRFATLQGHLEAGEIEFRASRTDRGFLRFEIESWTRSGDALVDLLYDRFAVARELQLLMWSNFCTRVAARTGGVLMSNVTAHTDRRVDREVRTTGSTSGRARRALDDLHDKAVNFDVERRTELAGEPGWHLDEYCEPLPQEPPGQPVERGSWEVARGILERYDFADPDLVRAIYYPDVPLEERDMILEGRFWGLRFLLGLRIGGVIDQTTESDGRPVRLWGWNYRTLQGHLEMGQMDYEIRKWLDTGEVEFRICAVSSAARIPNPIVRLGFRLFGRRMQQRFAHRALERMTQLVDAELEQSPRPERAVEGIDVRPATERPRARRRLAAQRQDG